MGGLLFCLLPFWYASGVWGLVLLWKKRRLAWFTDLGCITWILFGWFVALIVLCIPLALGPFTLWIGKSAEDRSASGRSLAAGTAPSYTSRRPPP